ncbi:MAG: hypothetical protein H0V81_06700, partial [Solirubrobacterales bacterium]|nr:hypothetical protein [Solirubrobacterales bacterium]
MTLPSPRSVLVRPEGRDGELAALEAALEREGPGTVILEGPEGSGADALLDYVAGRASELGRPTVRWPFGVLPPDRPPEAVPRVVLCVDEAAALDGDGVRAFPVDGLVVLALRAGTALADPAAMAALRARSSTTVLTLGPLDVGAVSTLLQRRIVGAPPAEALAEACVELTGGSAQLLTEVVAVLAEAADPRVGALDLLLAPLVEALAARWEVLLDGAGADCVGVADAATLLADGTPLWVVCRLPGRRASYRARRRGGRHARPARLPAFRGSGRGRRPDDPAGACRGGRRCAGQRAAAPRRTP